MAYLLDTNAWVVHLRKKDPRVTQKIARVGPADIWLCSVVLAELIYGAHKSGPTHEAANLTLIAQLRGQYACIALDEPAAEAWGRVRHHLALLGNPIGPNDLLIASIALAHGLTLVTHNTAEFQRVPGLVVEDWQLP